MDFQEPPAEYGPVAMWFLNTHLSDAELRRQISSMAAGGLGGVQVAARTGLQTPYLSEQWMQVIELIQDAAEQHGLAVWLADEYPYPSGASGGEVVLRHPEFRAWQMHAERMIVSPGEEIRAAAPGTVLLRACGVPVRGGRTRWAEVVDLERHVGWVQQEHVLFEPSQVYLTTRRYLSNAPRPTLAWRAPPGAEAWEIWLIAAAELTDYKFFGSYVDLCNADACKEFIATTYERYFARLGPERFSRLAGFFLDEAHPQNWSWRLPEFFRQRRGYDVVEALPALWTDIGPRTARVRYDYRQSITELFDHSFMRPVAEWCLEHGVQLSLEVPSTRNVVQRHATVPGIDPGHDKVGVPLDEILARELPSFRGNLGFPGSLAAQTGRRRVLDELFHSVGWSLTLQDMKAMLDRAAARGANLFAFHAFCYTIGGLRKWDAPPSEFEQNPYWPSFGALATYAARLAYALSRGRRVAPIALVDPITSLWAHAALPGLELDTLGQRVMHDWTRIMRELLAVQRPYDNIDPGLLAQATLEEGHLRIGEADYEVVVLPSVTNLEQAAWTTLEGFATAGGTVIACGLLPTETIEVQSQVMERCRSVFAAGAAHGFARVHAPSELLHLLDQCLPADLRLLPEGGDEARRQFLLAQRREADADLFFLANAAMAERTCEVALRAADSAVRRLDLETGTSETMPSWDGDDGTLRLRLDFAGHGAQLLLVEPKRGRAAALRADSRSLATIDIGLGGDWRVDLPEGGQNTLRLDRFCFTLADAATPDTLEWPPEAPFVEPKPLINIFRDVARMQGKWPGHVEVQPIFGAAPRIGLRLPATAWFATSFTVRTLPRDARLCIEDAVRVGDWDVWVNRRAIPRAAFEPKRRWSIDNREGDVAHVLMPGANELVVRVRVTDPAGGLVDALYVLGDFGVFHDRSGAPTLDEAPSRLRWSERHASGFPFFSGTFRLRKHLRLPVPGGRFRLRLPDADLMFAGVVELAVDGRSLGRRAWAPFAWEVPEGLISADVDVELSLWITTTLAEQLEGKRYDPTQRRTVAVVPQRGAMVGAAGEAGR